MTSITLRLAIAESLENELRAAMEAGHVQNEAIIIAADNVSKRLKSSILINAQAVGVDEAAPLTVGYTNYRGDYAIRKIIPIYIWYGTSRFHAEDGPQYFLHGYDCDKLGHRDFALKDFGAKEQAPAPKVINETPLDFITSALEALPYGTRVERKAGSPQKYPSAVIGSAITSWGDVLYVVEASGEGYERLLHMFPGAELVTATDEAATEPAPEQIDKPWVAATIIEINSLRAQIDDLKRDMRATIDMSFGGQSDASAIAELNSRMGSLQAMVEVKRFDLAKALGVEDLAI